MSSEGGSKFDSEKPKMGLIPSKPLIDVAKVLTFGARKYQQYNWKKGFDYSRLYDAAQRHLTAWNDNETYDSESNLNHLAHAICDLMFLLDQHYTMPERDDRYKPEVKEEFEVDEFDIPFYPNFD